MEVISILAAKGGAGKTTTAFAFADGLQRRNKKVLLIDLDISSNLSSVVRADGTKNIYNVLVKDMPIVSQIQVSNGFNIVAGSDKLSVIAQDDDNKYDTIDLIHLMKNNYLSIFDNYDYCIIDNMPSFGWVQMLSIGMSHKIIIPSTADYFTFDSIRYMLFMIHKMTGSNAVYPKVDGILMIKFNQRQIFDRNTYNMAVKLTAEYNTKVFNTTIRNTVAVPEAMTKGKTIYSYNKRCTAAIDYDNFVDEFLRNDENEQ